MKLLKRLMSIYASVSDRYFRLLWSQISQLPPPSSCLNLHIWESVLASPSPLPFDSVYRQSLPFLPPEIILDSSISLQSYCPSSGKHVFSRFLQHPLSDLWTIYLNPSQIPTLYISQTNLSKIINFILLQPCWKSFSSFKMKFKLVSVTPKAPRTPALSSS